MKKLFLLAIIFFGFLLIPNFCFALTISPPTLELEIEPGQNLRAIVKVFNETDRDLSLSSLVEPFQAAGETGQPKFTLPEEKNKFLEWFQISAPTLVLKPGQIALIPFEIKAPKDAVAGGYYAAILWQESPGKVDSGVKISSKVGTLVLLKVKGEVKEIGKLLEFQAQPLKKFSLPVDFLIKFQNLGNVHLKPQGEMVVKNFLGKTVMILKMNSSAQAVLPQSSRKFEVIWGEIKPNQNFFNNLKQEFAYLLPGKYLVELKLESGIDQKQNYFSSQFFWLIPWRLILIIILIIIFGVLVRFKLRRKLKVESNEQKSQS